MDPQLPAQPVPPVGPVPPAEAIASVQPMLSVRNLVKRFGGLVAVNDVSLDIAPGEVVALVGDNGAGKSTLIKCVSGVYHPDGGEILLEGQVVHFSRPLDARKAGIETIYQDLALASNLHVSANIFLGREARKRRLGVARSTNSSWPGSRRRCDSLGIRFPTSAPRSRSCPADSGRPWRSHAPSTGRPD